MTTLADIAHGIFEIDNPRSVFDDDDAIVEYATHIGVDISYREAETIQKTCLPFLARLEAGEINNSNQWFHGVDVPLNVDAGQS